MIYNLVELLMIQFLTETIFANERKSIGGNPVPDRCALVIENSGEEKPWILSGYQMAQILTRDITSIKSRKFAWDIFLFLTNHWGKILPSVTVDGTVYPEIQTGQISALARPQSLGEDEEGRTEFSTNYQIYWRRI